ncbi:ABC transporter permease [Paradevosia shaoguanensis]|uniref:ABC transporter permease n=1 Tax=Paradevosia shaoguanensis TaxID=1335043 RepID=UPI0019331E88|nr:ABC transporter permease [Paradevosia shaoguanensis]
MMDILDNAVLAGFIAASVRMAIPILLAAIGGMFSEKSGVLNIGLEGMMLLGCFVGFAAAYASGSLIVGVLAAIVAGALLGLVLGVFAITIGSNQVVVGIALNLLMVGVTGFFFRLFFGSGTSSPRIDNFQPIDFGALAQIPIIGPLLFQHDPLTYLALLIVVLAWVIMHRSTIGLAISAAGEHPEAAETLGLNVPRIRYLCLLAGGALAGLGGAFLSLSATGLFIDNMTSGRGYIALAMLILGRRYPFGILAAALLFGAADALQLRTQLLPWNIPLQFLLMLPYVLTIVVLAIAAGRTGAPAALGAPLRRHKSDGA